MDQDCFELLAAHEKLEAMRRYNEVLVKNEEIHKEEMRDSILRTEELTNKLNTTLDERIQDQKKMAKFVIQNTAQEVEIKEVKSKLESKNREISKLTVKYRNEKERSENM